MSLCLYVAAGRPNGWADQDQTWQRTHVDPGSVLVKVKVKVRVIYLCMRYNRINDSDTWQPQ